jgi:hypothetical protein
MLSNSPAKSRRIVTAVPVITVFVYWRVIALQVAFVPFPKFNESVGVMLHDLIPFYKGI